MGLPAACRCDTVAAMPLPTPEDVVQFWRDAGARRWFAKDDRFDALFRTRFLVAHEALVDGRLPRWPATPEGALAAVLLLDQFPRNAFRGTPRVYASDAQARETAARAVDAGHDRAFEPALRLFFYLPFMHSEALADQQRCVALCDALSPADGAQARHHRAIVERFGRFPHRNAVLGRSSTPEERSWLEAGGFKG